MQQLAHYQPLVKRTRKRHVVSPENIALIMKNFVSTRSSPRSKRLLPSIVRQVGFGHLHITAHEPCPRLRSEKWEHQTMPRLSDVGPSRQLHWSPEGLIVSGFSQKGTQRLQDCSQSVCPPTSVWHTNSHRSVSSALPLSVDVEDPCHSQRGVAWPSAAASSCQLGGMLSRFSRRYVRRQMLRDCRADGPSHGLHQHRSWLSQHLKASSSPTQLCAAAASGAKRT